MNHAESVLLANLTDADSLDLLVQENFSTEKSREVIPTVLLRDILAWCLDLYFQTGRQVAPTKEGIESTWGREMQKLELAIEDEVETDSLLWAITDLRTKYVEYASQHFVHDFSKEITEAPPPEKVAALKTQAQKLHELTHIVISHRQESPADQGVEDALNRYYQRAASNSIQQGLTFGIPMIDNHTLGVHDGEMCTFAAFSGEGKSWVAPKASLAEFERGRLSVFFTLENDLPMTFDRMACMKGGVDYEAWQRGDVPEHHLKRVKEYLERLHDSENAPIVIMPERGDRTALSMIRRALSIGADSIIIDQLSHVERKGGSKARERHHVFAENISEIKALISEGREKIPALVLHQINREGIKEARKSGVYVMDNLAESSQIERESDFVFAAYRSDEDKRLQQAMWQTLKGRRVTPKHWRMHWRLDVGDIRAIHEIIKEEASA